MLMSQQDNTKIIQPIKSTTQESLGIELQVDDREILTEHSFLTPTGHRVPVGNTLNYQYACNISIGTLPQELEVLLDTGSTRLWLPGVQCDRDDPVNHICRDVLRIGSLTVENQRFAGTGAVPGFDIGLDGILGLGYVRPDGESTESPFYNMVLQGLLDEPRFALYLGDNDHNDSEIVFGGTNQDHYQGNIIHLPVRRGSYWEVDLDAISLGDQTIEQEALRCRPEYLCRFEILRSGPID